MLKPTPNQLKKGKKNKKKTKNKANKTGNSTHSNKYILSPGLKVNQMISIHLD